MADPLSVAASVVGLLTAGAQITQVLSTFISRAKWVPQDCRIACDEIADVRRILSQLQAFLLGVETVTRSQSSLILVEQVLVILTSCVTTFSEADVLVHSLDSEERMGLLTRIRWAEKTETLSDIVRRLQMHKSSLGLMLSILTCQSMMTAESHVHRLYKLVDQALAMDERLANRLKDLDPEETRFSRVSRSVCGPQQDVLTQRQDEIPEQSWRISTGSSFEEVLMSSRVYKRSARGTSREFSLASSAGRTGSWTMLSGLSLSEISNLSILALPLYSTDIVNPQCYSFEDATITDHPKQSTKTQTESFPLEAEQRAQRRLGIPKFQGEMPQAIQASDQRIFGVSMEASIRYASLDIAVNNNMRRSHLDGHVPIIVAECCTFIIRTGRARVNIFSQAGSPLHVQALQAIFDSPNTDGNGHGYGEDLAWDGYSPYDCASVLLRYLKSLPEPVIPYSLYGDFIAPARSFTQNSTADWEELGIQYRRAVAMLPSLRRRVLLLLVEVLATVAFHRETNNMTTTRLCATFHPAILSQPAEERDSEEYQLAQRAAVLLVKCRKYLPAEQEAT